MTLKVALLFIGLLLPAVEASAAPKCGDRNELIRVLKDKYREEPRALGLSTRGTAMFEIYTSKSGTWTIVMTTTNGLACIMAAGHSWEMMSPAIGKEL